MQSAVRPVRSRQLSRGPMSRPWLVAPSRRAEGAYFSASSSSAEVYRSVSRQANSGASTTITLSAPWEMTSCASLLTPSPMRNPKYRAFYIQSWEGLHCQKDFFQSIPNEH